jgi:hypothetical protein
MTTHKKIRDKIVSQAIDEIQFARQYKQGIIWRWWKNEDLFYGKKDNQYYGTPSGNNYTATPNSGTPESRANVNIASAKTVSFVETVLSKIDSPLTFKFKKASMADYKRTKLLNALKDKNANDDDWNYKDLLGKVDAILYGRAVYTYYADSIKGYMSHLENVSVYDFLIDPSAGGFNLDNAMFLGRYNIRRSKYDLEKGKKDGIYIKSEVDKLISGSGNDANQLSQEDINKENKYAYIGSPANRTINNPDMYKFWEWYTTYEGDRYYLLMTENGECIRCEKLRDLFAVDPKLGDAMYPFWSYAFMPNLTEFWTPSKVDYVREIFLAQGVSINQMLDNAEAINKPQRAVDVSSIENVADLVYRRNGVIRMKPGVNINNSFKILEVNSINTPIQTYNTLESIQQLESGITAGAKGVAEEDKVGIYEGNQANTADRYGVWNKSYSQGYKRFAILWKRGVEDHLTMKTAVKILGPQGLEETVFITKRDLKPKAEYDVLVESTNAEEQADNADKKNKITFMAGYKGDPGINQKVLFEKGASIIGFNNDDIRQMLDLSEYGDADLIGEAERDIEDLLNEKIIEPNEKANGAYASHIVNYMRDHKEDMTESQFLLFNDYLKRVEPIVVRNMGTQFFNTMVKEGLNPQETSNVGASEIASVQPETMGQTQEQLTTNEPNGLTPQVVQ